MCMTALPLTPIERYFFHDHRETHPAWIRYDFTFDGALQREPFVRAWQQIPKRHPLTSAIVATRRWGRPVWKLDAAQPELKWNEAGEATEGNVTHHQLHDLRTCAGFAGNVQAGAGETRLSLHVHHAVADGCGLILIAEDLFALYAAECGIAIKLPPPGELRSQKSGSLGLDFKTRQWPWLFLGVVWAMILGRQRVVELLGAHDKAEQYRGPARLAAVYEETIRLRQEARRHEASLNDLLIRDVQAAAGVWLQQHMVPGAEELVRLLVPVNTGKARSKTRNSANALGVALIERRVRSLARRPRLLQRARDDLEFIQRRGLMAAFGGALWLRGFVPGGIARHCRRGGARSTLVLSNLGKVFSRGPLVRADGALVLPGGMLTHFAGWGPCRPSTNIFVVVAEYRKNACINIAFDPAAISEAQAQDFAQEFQRQLQLSRTGE